MIGLEHASFSSVLACAAATTLPPSPIESASRCDSPTPPAANIEVAEPPVIPANPTESVAQETSELNCTSQVRSTASTTDANDRTASPVNDETEPNAELTPEQGQRDETTDEHVETPEPVRTLFSQFARHIHLEQHQKGRKVNLVHRLRDLRVSVGLSIRLLRVGSTVQKGLVENFKQGDKSGFISIYNAICDMREACDATLRRNIHGHDPLISNPLESGPGGCSNFVQRLTQRSKDDLLEILNLARTDSEFLFRCIARSTPSQISALISPVHTLDANDSGFSAPPRGRTQPLFSKRTTAHSQTLKDHIFALERTDPLSALVFNVFTDPLDADTAESQLRLDVWSSTCAKLISYSGSGSYPFVGHLISCWASAREWKAQPRFETYLMDVLQEGAFLLEQHDMRHLGLDAQVLDPLQTDVAENFFQSAVSTLFEVLDDPDGGLPAGALEFGRATFAHLNVTETRKRFSEHIFFQWFFCKFLHNALSYPESLGLLLDFHVTKDARDRLLGQIALRAQAQVSRVLHSIPQNSQANSGIRVHIDNMLSRLDNPITTSKYNTEVASAGQPAKENGDPAASGKPLLLSTTDITTVLDILFPKTMSPFDSPQVFQQQPIQSSSSSYLQSPDSPNRAFQPRLFQGSIDTLSCGPSSSKTVFTTEMSFQDAAGFYSTSPSYTESPISPQQSRSRNAERIRFEISEISEANDRPTMEHPANEDWAIIYVTPGGNELSYRSLSDDISDPRETLYEGFFEGFSYDEQDPLHDAILRLVDDFRVGSEPANSHFGGSPACSHADNEPSLNRRFTDVKEECQREHDFVDAHYWWNASRLLQGRYPSLSPIDTESKVITPMNVSAQRSTDAHNSTIDHCERSFVDLKRTAEHFRGMINKMMVALQRLRNKMWYMTDVKNSLRYEDARNVALALKKMGVPQTTPPSPDANPRPGHRTLGGSFLQKPEIQVMNVMKAPGNQGGPSKLSDEQVEVTQKWIERFGIDNFCKGEERIHRFCYEVKTSVSKVVGETMHDSPVLWSSELYQKERSLYESSTVRPVTGVSLGSNVRPSSIASEDSLHQSQLLRPMNDVHSIGRKSSYQSLASERWRPGRETHGGDTSSIGDSPGRTVSTSTGDLYQSFWSPSHTQAQSMTSASSLYSRPPSTFGEISAPKRPDRKTHRKNAFLDELRRTVTSLLLSDLGSPVWSCGSETDAWFSDYLGQDSIREQTRKRARTQKFLTRLNLNHATQQTHQLRRSRSVDSGMAVQELRIDSSVVSEVDAAPDATRDKDSDFSYESAFRQLMNQFSRPANPYVKLKALQDMRYLAIASLSTSNTTQGGTAVQEHSPDWEHGRFQRNSVSEGTKLSRDADTPTPVPPSPAVGSASILPGSSESSSPTEHQVIGVLRDLIQKMQPKTVFRDLQYIASFIPSETLNKTDGGMAFLHFGLAALALKDEICQSIVEIADKIVTQELNTRQRRPTISSLPPLMGRGIRDAAQMWTIPAREGNAVAQRELAILYLTHPDQVRCVTLPLTKPRDTFKTEMMYRRGGDSKSDPQSMCLALHWMKLAAAGGDKLAQNRLREREEFDSIA